MTEERKELMVRSIPVPQNRFTPIKKDWQALYKILVTDLGLEVRMNLKTRSVDVRSTDSEALQKGYDVVSAYNLGFKLEDVLAIVSFSDVYVESVDIRDVRLLKDAHLSRAIGRVAGTNGKTKRLIENTSRTKIVMMGSKVHILGGVQNIRIAKDAIETLVLGSPTAKMHERMKMLTTKMQGGMY